MLCSSELVLFHIDACRESNFESDSVASATELACLVFTTPPQGARKYQTLIYGVKANSAKGFLNLS